MVWGGVIINNYDDDDYYDAIRTAYKLLFSGGLITTLFWVMIGCICVCVCVCVCVGGGGGGGGLELGPLSFCKGAH